jgi:hypothetical protein
LFASFRQGYRRDVHGHNVEATLCEKKRIPPSPTGNVQRAAGLQARPELIEDELQKRTGPVLVARSGVQNIPSFLIRLCHVDP